MTNRVVPSIEREINDRRPGDGALFIKANLADIVAPFDDDDENAAFGGEVAGDIDEEPTVVEVVAAVHPVVVVLVIAISIVLVLAIAVVLVHAIVAIPVLTIVVGTVHKSVVAVVHTIAIIPIHTIAVVPVFAIVVVFSLVVVVVIPIVLVLAIPIILLLIALVVVEVMVVLILATIIAVVVVVVVVDPNPVVATCVFVTIVIAVVVAGPSARELAVAVAFNLGARSRAIVVAALPLGDTGKDDFGTSHEACVKAFALPKLGIRERDLGFFSWDKAWREVESGVGVVAFGEEVLIFGGAGIEVDEFREKGGDVVRGQGCLYQNMD